VWVLAAGALVIVLGVVASLRGAAVLARHRAESAADFAALAAAGRIGVASDECASAVRVARRNGAVVRSCRVSTTADGRSGTVRVEVGLPAALPWVSARTVSVSARAGRLPAIAARSLSRDGAARDRGG
jgi:secretion/DNA translocation related TadE-like protein